MGIEFLKYLLAAAGLQIDRSAAENLRPNKSFHLCVHENRVFLNSSGIKYLRGCQSLLVPLLRSGSAASTWKKEISANN